ncbi:FAD-binding oxidoreductase [Kaistia dalseonensis]|uniref:D-amino-acid dehydrogenase n=1 Tax=Kaistia dalseonensis TaxID=410840 RepID=A0ABU0HBD0_9HYPH|nr:FAD-binding oxidoreductase [Kaistia dalseonensis]MCX5496999.1 FAD-binding oxidoreductase [Kaistia dalseonensis]MDQ0439625.1 D-amino-acid dehydrogenase [Kaistia dalseonensis]
MKKFDAIVLGAGIVGVSAALNLLKRNRSVVLVDRSGAGEATSYGNAGVIEREGFYPIVFPRKTGELWSAARNGEARLHYNARYMPKIAPWLLKLRAASAPRRVEAYAEAMNPILSHAASEHGVLAGKSRALEFYRGTGWLRGHRSVASFAASGPQRALADHFGVRYEILDNHQIADLEPDLAPVFARAVLWPDTVSVSSPGGVTKSFARLFELMGGGLGHGDARSLRRENDLWVVDCASGPVTAPDVVVALGPWSMDVLGPLGYRFPLAVKRGYHLHFKPRGDAALDRPIVDVDHGYVLTPMRQGYRITSGIEFDDRDAPPTPVQIERILPQARALFPIGDPIEREPWMGSRPCFPDSMPVVGPAPRHPGLWLDFGHGHLGFTLGPATGRLLAELITREMPFVDPAPFAATRFRG